VNEGIHLSGNGWAKKAAANVRRFLSDLERASSVHICTILTPSRDIANEMPCRTKDNGKEFIDRLFGRRKRDGRARVRLPLCGQGYPAPPYPAEVAQTNGMVERFNGRTEEVLQSHHFRSGEELARTLRRYF
jgi:hypothetical protein